MLISFIFIVTVFVIDFANLLFLSTESVHCVKNVQIRTRKKSVFGHFSRRDGFKYQILFRKETILKIIKSVTFELMSYSFRHIFPFPRFQKSKWLISNRDLYFSKDVKMSIKFNSYLSNVRNVIKKMTMQVKLDLPQILQKDKTIVKASSIT